MPYHFYAYMFSIRVFLLSTIIKCIVCSKNISAPIFRLGWSYPLWLCKKTLTIKSNIYNNHIFVQSWYCGYWCGSLINYINLSQITCLVHQYLELCTCGFFETVFAFLHSPGNISASPFVHANIRETFCKS